jgi:hypothetical protein
VLIARAASEDFFGTKLPIQFFKLSLDFYAYLIEDRVGGELTFLT